MAAVSNGSGKTITALQHTKWSYILLSIITSALSLLSKEQGVTVVGVCAAFDVLLNWDSIQRSLSSKWDSTVEQVTSIPEDNAHQAIHRLTKTSTGNTTRVKSVHVNGISSLAKKNGHDAACHSSGSKVHNTMLRLGECMCTIPVHCLEFLSIVFLVVCGLLLVWFRMSMNYGSHPVFKPYEMRAAHHPDRTVRQVPPDQSQSVSTQNYIPTPNTEC